VSSAVPLTPLAWTATATPTDIWIDTCAVDELEHALNRGAVGATSNPKIVTNVWKKDSAAWGVFTQRLAVEHSAWTEVDLAWAVVGEMSVRGAKLLEPLFAQHGGRKGRLSVQTNPTFFRSADLMLEQGTQLAKLAGNIMVKLPVTKAGIVAIEEATFRGITVTCTVSFSVAQAIAAAEAVERGLRRRTANGLPSEHMSPVVVIMVGRLEDWLRVQSERNGISASPIALLWSGVAVFKRAYQVFRANGFASRLLAAAIRHEYHWSEFVGGDVVVTIPSTWQERIDALSVELRPRMDDPVDTKIIDQLLGNFPDFRRAYEPDGLGIDEFDSFPPTVLMLRDFIASYHELLSLVSSAVLPDPAAKEAL
jgi:transaldolase